MQEPWFDPVITVVFGYLLGSIPFGLLIGLMGGAGDVRAIGSGNIGATNVLRTGRKGLAALTLLLDIGKGALAVYLGEMMMPGGGEIAGAAAFVGHCYPVWLRFNGGKGVATLLGVSAALSWQIGFMFAIVWLCVLAMLRYSSLSGMMGAISAPFVAWALDKQELIPVLLTLSIIVLWKHRSNIHRLATRTEPKVGTSR